uniref:Uncharacterized protein n=1 Tax=Strongyloides stercoralis TaxID=6248 RepID=A0AAF5DMC0_STRER
MSSFEASKSSNNFLKHLNELTLATENLHTLNKQVDHLIKNLTSAIQEDTDLTSEKMEKCQLTISKICDHGEEAVKMTHFDSGISKESITNKRKIYEIHKKINKLRKFSNTVKRSL